MIFDFSQFRRKFPNEFDYLALKNLHSDPFIQCQKWFEDVIDHDLIDGNAMNLSTANSKGEISARIVLLKYLDEKGFVFFTNYKSRKSKDIEENPRAVSVFYWPSLNRQLRVTGEVEKISKEESLVYFKTRPRQNQLLAWASNQDEEILSTQVILEKMKAVDQMYPTEEVPLPLHWGGFRLLPQEIEFWQGGPSRINQRFVYYKLSNSQWSTKQLSP